MDNSYNVLFSNCIYNINQSITLMIIYDFFFSADFVLPLLHEVFSQSATPEYVAILVSFNEYGSTTDARGQIYKLSLYRAKNIKRLISN